MRIEAVGTQILERVSWDQGTLTHEPQVIGQAAHLWTRTDLRPADVDLALVYDGFTFNAISWIEGLGFCGFGEAYDWLDGGRRIALDGELPGEPARRPALGGTDPRVRVPLRSGAPAAPRRGRAAGRAMRATAVVTSGGGTPSGVLLLQRKDGVNTVSARCVSTRSTPTATVH